MMDSKKILFVGYDMPGFGGKETVCKNVYYMMMDKNPSINIEFLFIQDFRQGPDEISDEWLGDISFSRISSGVYNTKIRRIHFSYKFAKFLKKKKPDIIISIDPLSCYVTSLGKKLAMVKIPIYSWIHSSLDQLYKSTYSLNADYHLAISSGIKSQFIRRGVSADNIFTIFNPIKRSSEIMTRPSDIITFLYVGRLTDDDKNISEMFTALSKVNGNFELHIVGSGRDENELKNLANKLKLQNNIIWHGWKKKPWEFIESNIKEITTLLLTSNFEGFPMVLGEAISRGIYCISSNCITGPEDIIIDGINGELYPLNSVNCLVEKLQYIIDGKQLPNNIIIKESIEDLYEEKYIENVFYALENSNKK